MGVEVDVFGFTGEEIYLRPGEVATLWFGSPEIVGWSFRDYSAVSPMLGSTGGNGPLEIIGQGVYREIIPAEFPISQNRRTMTFRNPTSDPLVFHVRAVRAPARY